MKTFKQIREQGMQFAKDNPDSSLTDAYQRGYADAVHENNLQVYVTPKGEPTLATDEIFAEEYPFEMFWDIYGKKTGKKKCELKWKRLSEKDKALIMQHVPLYVASTPDVYYRKHPLTYLNGECWNDEIINKPHGTDPQLTFAEQTINGLGSLIRQGNQGV